MNVNTPPPLTRFESETEMVRFVEYLGARAGVPIHDEPHFRWISARPAIIPNIIFNLNFSENDSAADAELNDIIRRINLREIPFSFIVTPNSRPAALASLLETHGFVPHVQWSGMTFDLDRFQDTPPPAGVEIRPLDCALLEEWTTVVTLNLFGGAEENLPPMAALYQKVLGSDRMLFYAALIQGQVVATAKLFLDGGLAGIHAVSTHADFRNRGIGRAITNAALKEAQRRGAQRAVLQASPLGEAVYRKLGFKEECRMTVYRYPLIT